MHIFIKVYLKHQKFSLFLHKGAVWGNVFGRAGVLCSVGSVFVSSVHRMDMGKKAVECGADIMIGKGPLMKNACEETERAGIETMHFDTSEDIMRALDNCLRDGDTVLVKASHGTNLKDVAEYIKANF